MGRQEQQKRGLATAREAGDQMHPLVVSVDRQPGWMFQLLSRHDRAGKI
jgi:hypothetical protein